MELVWDRSDYTLHIGQLTVIAAPPDYPPFQCEAVVEEQDTWLVLGKPVPVADTGPPLWYLSYTLDRAEPLEPGTVLVKASKPVRLLAVVLDVDQEPMCRPEYVVKAYCNVMQMVQDKNIASLALPLLGTIHGNLSINESLQLLNETVLNTRQESLKELWLQTPPGCDHGLLSILRTESPDR